MGCVLSLIMEEKNQLVEKGENECSKARSYMTFEVPRKEIILVCKNNLEFEFNNGWLKLAGALKFDPRKNNFLGQGIQAKQPSLTHAYLSVNQLIKGANSVQVLIKLQQDMNFLQVCLLVL
ncbi:hypothetical protein HS088_TW09G00375 [Tripterygium wilfordii]|uniref:Uncharacterized protein n=1 Tax=Tripterygium wilfordii TaxID=458696 RepID=A0A7J7D7P7_TRIWF|nr:hypothetical protein HS088_TW09G00375 [Tripterygium wilfordii]